MGEDGALDGRITDHSNRIAALEKRIGDVESKLSATMAIVASLQEAIREAKDAALRSLEKVDQLKSWMMVTLAALAMNVLLMVLKGAFNQ